LNSRNLKSYEESLRKRQAELNNRFAAAQAYQPVRGEITKHKAEVKRMSEQFELINKQVAAFASAKPLVDKIVSQPLKIRLYYQVGDTQYDLVSPYVDQSEAKEAVEDVKANMPEGK